MALSLTKQQCINCVYRVQLIYNFLQHFPLQTSWRGFLEPGGPLGGLELCLIIFLKALYVGISISNGLGYTTHVTPSEHGGVVNDPGYVCSFFLSME
jgi:hypothetical protein